MIYMYTGTPGSGKSLDVARLILKWLKKGYNVIGTMVLNKEILNKYKGKYFYIDIYSMDVKEFIEYARRHNKKGKESQVLIVLDECQRILNPRDWQKPDRRAWNDFFQVHRHFGYDIYLVTQFPRLIDRQVLALVEFNSVHRKVGNYGLFGWVLSLFFAGKLFIAIEVWYPMHYRIGQKFFTFRPLYGKLYDSYMAFDENLFEANELADLLRTEVVSDAPSASAAPKDATGGMLVDADPDFEEVALCSP